MEGKIKIGPVGRHDPKSTTLVNWDEGGHNGIISQIFLSHGASGIFSIQFQFLLDDNKFVLSDLHGHNSGYLFDVITLDMPHEYITGISGTFRTYFDFNSPHLKSLKLTTNTKEYGPFGSSNSHAVEKFEFKLGKFRQLGGFFGTYDVSGLQYIGVYLQPTTVNPKSKPKTGTSNGDEIESNIVLG